jgi:tetratricopeptide (TPR) repeat protein
MRSDPAAQSAILPQEQRAREFLAQGRFRKARDELKALCKIDRARYLPLLIEANCGLAREMAAKGMNGEAMQVLAYLKTLASTAQIRSLEIELSGAKTPGGAGKGEIFSLMAEPGLPESERQRLADGAVLMFDSPANGSAPALEAELQAIIGALQAICQGRYPQALDLIRPLPHSSPFSLWKLFVKGQAAFHSGEMDKAARFFGALPALSLPGKAARPYLLLAQGVKKDAALAPESVIEMACRMAEAPGCGLALLRAEEAWRGGRPADMYRRLRDGIVQFPSLAPDFVGVLSSFAINVLPTLQDRLHDDYLDCFESIALNGTPKSTVELAMLTRIAVVTLANVMNDTKLVEEWEKFIVWCDQLHGPNPKRSSLALGWLGGILASNPDPDERDGSGMRNPKEAQRLLEESLRLDPHNLGASLLLCKVFDRLERKGDKKHLLDMMAERFPDQKEVLLMAGRNCLEHKACAKALHHFQQAMAADRLDPAIPDWVSRALTAQALHQGQAGRLDKARETMEKAIEAAVDSPPGAERARWRLNTYKALLELFFGNHPAARGWLDEARAQSPSAAAFLFYSNFASLQMGPKARQTNPLTIQFLAMAEAQAQANGRDALLLTEIWVREKERVPMDGRRDLEKFLAKYLKAAARIPFDRQEAVRIVEFALDEEKLSGITGFKPAAKDFVRRHLKADPKDPRFRFYSVCLSGQVGDESVLQSIIDEAIRRKEEGTARLARRQLEISRRPPPLPLPMPRSRPAGEEFADEFGGDAADALQETLSDTLGDYSAIIDGLFPMASYSEKAQMMIVFGLLAAAPDELIEEAKRNPPPGISRTKFGLLLDALREIKKTGAPSKLKPPSPPPVPRQRRPDPSQPELF